MPGIDPAWHLEHAISLDLAVRERHGAVSHRLIAHAPLLWEGGHVAVVDLPDGRRVSVPVRAPDYAAEDLLLQGRAHADAAARMSEVVRLLEESRDSGDSS